MRDSDVSKQPSSNGKVLFFGLFRTFYLTLSWLSSQCYEIIRERRGVVVVCLLDALSTSDHSLDVGKGDRPGKSLLFLCGKERGDIISLR